MKEILLTWVGENDKKAIEFLENGDTEFSGPIFGLLNSHKYSNTFDEVHLLFNGSQANADIYFAKYNIFIKNKQIESFIHVDDFSDPTDFKRIIKNINKITERIQKKYSNNVSWHFHVSPGTFAMAASWILLGKTRFDATLYQTWFNKNTKQQNVKIVQIPFNLEIEYTNLQKKIGVSLDKKWNELPGFKDIIFSGSTMQKILQEVQRIANFDVTTLILGETGTGKELIANAIHLNSIRKRGKLITVNCAAIPENLFESELFGSVAGAFTGAINRNGHIREAHNGILFLDEIGELPLNVQSKLLRFLEYKTFHKVGSNKKEQVDVRVISATNRNLSNMVKEGKFREDLFHRIALGLIKLPSLYERKEDIPKLVESFLSKANKEFKNTNHDYTEKQLSETTMKFIVDYHWVGNVRELMHTIKRVLIHSSFDKKVISLKEFQSKLLDNQKEDCMIRSPVSLYHPIDLEEYLNEIRQDFIKKALEITEHNKTKAAQFLGYANRQTLTNKMNKNSKEKL